MANTGLRSSCAIAAATFCETFTRSRCSVRVVIGVSCRDSESGTVIGGSWRKQPKNNSGAYETNAPLSSDQSARPLAALLSALLAAAFLATFLGALLRAAFLGAALFRTAFLAALFGAL